MSSKYFTKRSKCPSCMSKNYTQIYSISYEDNIIKDYLNSFYLPKGKVEFNYFKNAKYILNECNECSLIFQQEIPDDILTQRLYNIWIDPKIASIKSKNHDINYYLNHASEIIKIISHFNTNPIDLSILDFGMGWANWCLMARAFGCNIYGCELSQERIENAKKHGIKTLEWNDLPNHKFDFINSEQVFEHLSEPYETLKYLAESLKPNGVIRISVPNGEKSRRTLKTMDWKASKASRDSLNIFAPLEHINCFTTKSIDIMAKNAGLKPIKSFESMNYCGQSFKSMSKNYLKYYYFKFFSKKKSLCQFYKKA